MNTPARAASEQLAKLSEALYRFSQSLDSSFGLHLKEVAVRLAGAIAADDQKGIADILVRAKGILALGERVGAIAANDVQVIAAAIARSRDLALPIPAKKQVSVAEFADIAGMEKKEDEHEEVTESYEPQQVERVPEAPARQEPEQQPVSATPVHPATLPAVQSVGRISITALSSLTASDRQSRIVAAIRQNPNVRMRDLIAVLPGVSERTIRYDLERLVTAGTIEREGFGGPATWYRLKEGARRV